jgi:hypothetical protein
MDDPALKDLWVPAMSMEVHCLAQGKEGVMVGTNTIFYLTYAEIRQIPKDCTVTYARIVINHHPQKDEPNQVWITVGGNLIDYPYELTTCTAIMVSEKISATVPSVPQEQNLVAWINTPLDQYEYMQMLLELFPDDIFNHYNLREKAFNRYVYMEI